MSFVPIFEMPKNPIINAVHLSLFFSLTSMFKHSIVRDYSEKSKWILAWAFLPVSLTSRVNL